MAAESNASTAAIGQGGGNAVELSVGQSPLRRYES
jgi:hypothetical protein